MNTPGLPPIISRTLAAFAMSERKVQVVRGLGESLIVYLGGLGAVALIDASLKPGHGWHWALSLTVYGLSGAVVVARVVLPFIRKPTEAEIAHAIESRIDDKLEEQLSSAVELAARSDPGVSAWMVERTVALGAQQVADLDVPSLIDRQPAQRAWKRAGVVLAAIAAACIVPGAASYLARAALPVLLRPAQVTISVTPGDQHLALGAALEVTITASPDPGAARLALAWDDGVDEAVEFTSQGEGRYTTRLPAVTNALRYRVTAGDGESASYRVTVSRPPVLGDLALRVTPPLYSGLPPRDITGGDAEVLAGSTVTLTAKLDGAPAVGGALVFDGGEQAATLANGKLLVVLKPTATIAYGLRLVGDGGLIAQPAQRWILSVRPDVPPVAQLTATGLEGGLVGDDEALLMSAALRDDLGLRSAELVVLVDGNERQVRPLPLPGGT
ncbi:MAG TPA: hypothetical protein VHX44_05720, partial [Planctomycetota bacterium]|nr:hypothetical protein [Planctomycetota bacterium]